jgi:hypothetical protein
MEASVALRTCRGSWRKSSPFNSMRSKALAVTDTVERCEPVVIACNGFLIDDARPWTQARQRLGNQREIGESCAGDDAEAIMLDLMRPLAARRQCCGLSERNGSRLQPAQRLEQVDDEESKRAQD